MELNFSELDNVTTQNPYEQFNENDYGVDNNSDKYWEQAKSQKEQQTKKKKVSFTDILSNAEMDALTGRQLVNKVSELTAYKHDVFYFGSLEIAKVTETLNKLHKIPAQLKDYPNRPDFKELDTKENKVVFVSFPEMTQAEIMMVSKGTQGFDLQQDIMSQLYNEYFGSGLSSVVFQEIREKRALAYSAYAFNTAPRDNRDAHYFRAYVGTQSDKIKDAVPAMNEKA